MLLPSFFHLALAFGVAYASPVTTAPSAPLITPAPLIPRALGEYFIGYAMYDDGSIETYTCPSSASSHTFTISSSHYAGCAYYATDIATSCYYNSIVYAGLTYSCSSYCVTNLIFTSVGDSYPASFIGCATRSVGLKVLRVSKEDLPTGSAAVSFASSAITKFVTVTPTRTATYVPTSSMTSAVSSSATSSPTNVPAPPKNNAPIIGGAVAGALIFLGLIGAGAFFFFSKRRAAATNTPYQGPDQAVAMSPAPAPPQAPYSPPPQVLYSPPPAYGQPFVAPTPGAGDGKQAQVAEYRVPEMTHHEVHGQSAPLSVAPMPVYNQDLPAAVDLNANRRSELA